MNLIIKKFEITHSLIILDKNLKKKLKNQQEIFQMLKLLMLIILVALILLNLKKLFLLKVQ